MIDNYNFTLLFKQQGRYIFDIGISGRDFGNGGFGDDIFDKCKNICSSLIGETFEYDNDVYCIVGCDVLRGLFGYIGDIIIACEKQ